MMDWIQLSSSLVAIILLAWGATKLFPAPAGLTAERILRNYARYAPLSMVATPIISSDKKAALLPMQGSNSEIGLVTQLGDRLVSRTLGVNSHVKWVIRGDSLIIRHDDFTQPSVTFTLPPADINAAATILSDFNVLSKRNNNAA